MLQLDFQKEIFNAAIHTLKKRSGEEGDPCIIIFWNENRLNELEHQGHLNPKGQIVAFLLSNGAESLGPFPDSTFYFREVSILTICRRLMKQAS